MACSSWRMEWRCRCVVASGTIPEWAAVTLNGPAFAQGRPSDPCTTVPHGGGRRLDVGDVQGVWCADAVQ
jgi:hypothetical protein